MSGRILADYENSSTLTPVNDTWWRKLACSRSILKQPPHPLPLPSFSPSASEKNIFFLETTCASTLNSAKMACAVESVATNHPNHTIHLALTTTHISNNDQFLGILKALPNIRITAFNPSTSLPSTDPLVVWLGSGVWAKKLDWASVILSDVLRLVVVCWVGGTYLDLDVLSFGPLPRDPAWVGREIWTVISNGAFSLPRDHWFCRRAKQELMEGFNEHVWGSTGPKTFTRTVTRFCNNTDLSTVRQCGNLTMLVPETLYPIHWREWKSIFAPRPNGEEWQKPPGAVALHLWNHISAKAPLSPGDGSVADQMARQNCPKIYDLLKNEKIEGQAPAYTGSLKTSSTRTSNSSASASTTSSINTRNHTHHPKDLRQGSTQGKAK